MKKVVTVHLAEGFEEIEAVSIIDVLRRAGLDVRIVSVTGQLDVTGSHGIRILSDVLFEDVDYGLVDLIILPGGMPGATHLKNHAGLQEQMKKFYRQGKLLGAICAAPLVFGHLGILRGHKATCYPGYEDQLRGATVAGTDIEVSGNIITGKGVGVAVLFALKIVEIFKGEKFAGELAEKMIVRG
ncbi:MAG: DJ-1 family glyoxalase III [Mariniphaga sp.]